jgi:hypothetical protein
MLAFNLLLLLLLYTYYYRVLRVNLHTSIFSFLLIYQGGWLAASIVFVEATEIYLSEIDRFAYFVYAVPIFMIFNISSIYAVNQGVVFFERRTILTLPRIFRVRDQLVVLKVIFIIVLVCLYSNLSLSPIPYFAAGEIEGFYSRFDFWKNARIPLFQIFGSIAGFLGIICGIVFTENKKQGIIMFVFYVLYVILLGHKFGTLIMLFFFFLLPYIILTPNFKISFSIKNIGFGIVVLVIFLLITLQNYSTYNPFMDVENIDTPLMAVLYRGFALQSQLFWVSVEQNIYRDLPQEFLLHDLYYGMISLMNKYHVSGDFDNGHSGSTLTNGYPAILLEIFALPFAFLINIIFSLIFAFMAFVIKVCIQKRNYIVYTMFYFVFTFFYNLLTMGNGKKGLIAILVSLPLLLFIVFRIKRNNDT